MSEHGTGLVHSRPVAPWIRAVTLVSAAFFIGFGLWALLAPESFLDQLATFEPDNVHVVHVLDSDLGGTPATGVPTFGILAVVLLAAGVARQRT